MVMLVFRQHILQTELLLNEKKGNLYERGEKMVTEESKIKSALLRTFISLVLCLGLIIIKFVLKDEKIVEDLYNYLTTDIVFLAKM